jgi:hypothetical protein
MARRTSDDMWQESRPNRRIMSDVFRPKILSMAMTSRCNLRCVMFDHGRRHDEKQDFDENLFNNIGNFIDSATMVDLTGSASQC